MKTAAVVVIVAAYGVVACCAGLCMGAYYGWHKRASADRWQLEDADKVISQAIEERQTALNEVAALHFDVAALHAELLRRDFAYSFMADLDAEYRRLIDEDS